MSRRPFLNLGAAHSERMSPADIMRFLRFVTVDENGCWIFKGAPDAKGYGRFKLGRKVRWAHRLAYITFRCALRAGNDVHHKKCCKSNSCVNPDHLQQRSREWNSADGSRRRSAQAAQYSEPAPF